MIGGAINAFRFRFGHANEKGDDILPSTEANVMIYAQACRDTPEHMPSSHRMSTKIGDYKVLKKKLAIISPFIMGKNDG